MEACNSLSLRASKQYLRPLMGSWDHESMIREELDNHESKHQHKCSLKVVVEMELDEYALWCVDKMQNQSWNFLMNIAYH